MRTSQSLAASPRPNGLSAFRRIRRFSLVIGIVCFVIAGGLVCSGPAQAGLNAGANAYLTWSATNKLVTDTTPAATNNLYVEIDRTGGLTFKGGELDLTWNPASDGNGCFDHIGTNYKTSSGTTCTYLNRGSTVPIVTEDVAHLHIAWANTSSSTGCTSGNAIQIQFETDGCANAQGCFTMNYMGLLDSGNAQDVCNILGKTATVSGGTSFCSTTINHPPTVNSIPDQTVAENHILTVVPVGNDVDGDPLTWSGSNLPGGSSVNTTNGTFTWTPSFTQAGAYNGVTLTATDTHGATGSASFNITVTNTNRPPTVSPIANQSVVAGNTLTVTPTGSEPDVDPVLTCSA